MKKFMSIFVVFGILLSACSSGATNSKQFVVGMECNYAPFNWSQPQSSDTTVAIDGGQYCDGYDVQVAKRIADSLGKELVIKKLAFDGLILAVQSGEIDAIVAGMSPTAERKEEIAFSTPYFNGVFGMMVRKDSKFANATSINDFAGAKVTAQLSTFHVDLIDQMSGVEKLSPMKDFPIMTVALNSGEIDGFVTEESTGKTIAATNPELVYVSFPEGKGFVTDIQFSGVAVGVTKTNTELLAEINKSLETFTKQEQQALMDAAMARQQ